MLQLHDINSSFIHSLWWAKQKDILPTLPDLVFRLLNNIQCELRAEILDYKSVNYVGWVGRSETRQTYFSVS